MQRQVLFMKRKIYLFAPIFLILVLFTTVIAPAVNMSEDISQKVLRLHIRANSESQTDQNLKLIVRDELLEETKDLFSDCNSLDEAIELTNNNLDFIRKKVDKTIKANGFNYDCKVRIDKEFFETRKYDFFTLPAGVYDALIIELGQGKGHNWWCVMFPAVCISGCAEDFEGTLTDEEIKMIENDNYIVKFKVVEIIEKIKSGANRIKS